MRPFFVSFVSLWFLLCVRARKGMSRIIPSDGRAHRKDLDPTYYGDSVGHWEGDTLVIDSTNFKRWILDDYHYTDETKTRWHSDSITIDDPQIFTAPWTQEFEMKLHPEWDAASLLEYVCEENNRCAGGTCRPADVQK